MEYVRVGWLGRSRGLSGDIWVTPDTDFPERFLDLNEIFVRNRDNWEQMVIVESALVGGRPTLRFEGIESPEAARRLTNRELAVSRDRVMELPEGIHYIFDLVGCRVVDEEEQLVGELVDVEAYPANDVYVIRGESGATRYLPVARPFVKEIDIAGKRIVIDRSGLFDATSASPTDTGNEV